MDDLTFSARRASAGASTAARPAEPADLETRFRGLVQSPLRAGILRYLNSRPEDSFDVETLMQTFGRLHLDVNNCVKELVDFGVGLAIPGTPIKYAAARPTDPALVELLDHLEPQHDRHRLSRGERRRRADAFSRGRPNRR